MNYPLGTFPRFGHQERWAQERRARASQNSAATRQAQAQYELAIEGEVLLSMEEVILTATANSPEGEAGLEEIKRRLDKIRIKHDAGQRVYYACLGETFQYFCRITGMSAEVQAFDCGRAASFVRVFGEERYSRRYQIPETLARHREEAMHSPAKSTFSDWYESRNCGSKAILISVIIYVLLRLCLS